MIKISTKSLLGLTIFVILVGLVYLKVNQKPAKKDTLEMLFEVGGTDYSDEPYQDEYIGNLLKAKSQVSFVDADHHRYDGAGDRMRSFVWGDEGDEDGDQRDIMKRSNTCNTQLIMMKSELAARRILYENYTLREEQPLPKLFNLYHMEVFDSFGSLESLTMRGNNMWLGSYRQCKEAKFMGRPLRYCIGKFTHPGWSKLDRSTKHIKLALCLPDYCDSMTSLREDNLELIDKIRAILRMDTLALATKLDDIYCLPDDQSELRKLSPTGRVFLATLTLWLSLVIVCSLYLEFWRFKNFRQSAVTLNDDEIPQQLNNKLIDFLALRNNWHRVFGAPPKPTSAPRPPVATVTDYNNNNDNNTVNTRRKISLQALDGIKVISTILVICNHVTMYASNYFPNHRDFWKLNLDFRFMGLMSGIYSVDTFITISGILTAYLKFSSGHHIKEDSFSSPRYWLKDLYRRYVRFMPLNIIMVLFIRELSRSLGSGPLWDYATANTTVSGICKHESLWDTILLQANRKQPSDQCVKSAWYVAADIQFMLVSPIFLIALSKSYKLGRLLIVAGCALSMLNQFVSIFFDESLDWSTIIAYKPAAPRYMIRELWTNYVLPQNRISTYLIGLLAGYIIFEKQEENVNLKDDESISDKKKEKERSSSWHALADYIGLDSWLPVLVLPLIIYIPLLGHQLNFSGMISRILTSLIIGTLRILWAICISRLVYTCARDGARSPLNRFLSWRLWKPWAKIGLSTLLTQWEIIFYLEQIGSRVNEVTLTFVLSRSLCAVVMTFAISLLVHTMIDAPISLLEHHYIQPKFFPDTPKDKVKQKSN